jgi:hypothetical protein
MRIHDASNVTFQREEVSHLTWLSVRTRQAVGQLPFVMEFLEFEAVPSHAYLSPTIDWRCGEAPFRLSRSTGARLDQAGPQGSVPISAGTETSTSSRSSEVAIS